MGRIRFTNTGNTVVQLEHVKFEMCELPRAVKYIPEYVSL